MKYTHLNIAVRRDTAEIHDLVDLALLGSVCLKKMISTGVFVLAVCALRRSIKGFPRKTKHDFYPNKAKTKPQVLKGSYKSRIYQRQATDIKHPRHHPKNNLNANIENLDDKIGLRPS